MLGGDRCGTNRGRGQEQVLPQSVVLGDHPVAKPARTGISFSPVPRLSSFLYGKCPSFNNGPSILGPGSRDRANTGHVSTPDECKHAPVVC